MFRELNIFILEISKHNKKWKEQYYEPLCARQPLSIINL